MATKEIRSEAWRAVFVPNDSDLDYFDSECNCSECWDSDDEKISNNAIASLEAPQAEDKMASSIESDQLGEADTFSYDGSMDTADEYSQSSETEAMTPSLRRSTMTGVGPTPAHIHQQPANNNNKSDDSSTMREEEEDEEDPAESPSPVQLDLPASSSCGGEQQQQQSRAHENHLYVTDSWLFKGIKEHVGDLHFCDVAVDGGVAVAARSRVDVLCEYTFIETTPSQRKKAEFFPAVYVPGNAYSWKTIQPQTNLHQGRQPAVMGDEHHARQPNFPYEPTLRALLASQQQREEDIINNDPPARSRNSRSKAVNMRAIEVFTDADVLSQLFTLLSDPARARPFRLDLSIVRNTLFLEAGRHHGRGHTDKSGGSGGVGGASRVRQGRKTTRPTTTTTTNAMLPPAWAADALRRVGFEAPRLPFSGGHHRVVRYRLGGLVCAVRSKVDFVYEGRKMPPKATYDPLRGVRPETMGVVAVPPAPNPQDDEEDDDGGSENNETTTTKNDNQDEEEKEEEIIKTWRTTVKHLGMGTKPAHAGKTSLRFAWEDDAASARRRMRTEMPLLWFGRTAYLADAVVSQDLAVVVSSKLRAIGVGGGGGGGSRHYRAWERAHQADLRLLSALLREVKRRARALGGTCVLVCDPLRRCFMVMRPVVEKRPVPEEVAVRLWGRNGGDGEDEGEEEEGPAETEYESTVASESSGLSTLRSRTPSGFTDWRLEEEEEEHMQQHGGGGGWTSAEYQRRPRRDVASRALVSQWLGRHQPDDDGLSADIEVDGEEDETRDELTPNDSQSRCGEDSSSEEDNNLPGCGVDGSMDIDEDMDQYEFEYASGDEYYEDEYGDEYEGQYDADEEDEYDTEAEEGDTHMKFATFPVDTEDDDDVEMHGECGSDWSSGASSHTVVPQAYGRRYMC